MRGDDSRLDFEVGRLGSRVEGHSNLKLKAIVSTVIKMFLKTFIITPISLRSP